MSLCAACGLELYSDTALCPHHVATAGEDWAAANRIYCDFFHRGKVSERLTEQERADDFWASSDAGMF